jgi:hypothetical protein
MLNRVRLPFYLSKPQYPAEEDVYLKGNGTRVVLKAIVSKVMDGKTDWMPSLLHERLNIALRHDEVNIESEKYTASVKLVGAYEIDWSDFLDYPFAPASFKAFEEAFVARSNRCDICAETNFLTLRDDYEPTFITEGDEVIINVSANDSICCSDPVFDIFSYDSDLIDSITISQVGMVTMTLKTPLNSYTNKELFVYSVRCGELEETATFTGNIAGTLSTPCEEPSNLVLSLTDPSSNPFEILAEWDEPGGGPPAGGYDWELTDSTDLVVGSGNTASTNVSINFLDCDETYTFRVRAICAVDDESADIVDTITTPSCDPESFAVRYTLLEGGVCTLGSATVYAAPGSTFTTGTQLYLNSNLTGTNIKNFIVLQAGGAIYEIFDGLIGAPTGNNC